MLLDSKSSAVHVEEYGYNDNDTEGLTGVVNEELALRNKLGSKATGYGSFCSLDTEEHHKATQQIIEVPQGRHLGIYSTTILFVSRILGSGIFTIPSSMYVNCGGNVTIFFGIWILTAILAFAGLYLFLEFGSWIPKSGGRKNFLEQTYTKPNLMMSVTFACYSLLSGLTLSNSIVFGKYILYTMGYNDISESKEQTLSKLISVGVILLAVLIHGISVRHGIFIQNLFGGLKLIMILLMCGTGLYSLFIYKPAEIEVSMLPNNFHYMSLEEGSMVSISSIAAAITSSFFCFAGWDSVHSVVSEIKNPSRTLRISGPVSLLVCFICYILVNLAYLKVLTFQEIKEAGPLIGSVLFTKLFGVFIGGKILSITVALSALSNILVVTYGISRMNQEIFREGYLPFSKFMASNYPRDAPLPSIALCGILTIVWIVLLPGDSTSFDYLINMEGYGNQFFLFLVVVGLFIYRHTHKSIDQSSQPGIKASSTGIVALGLLSLYLLAAPFIDSKDQAVRVAKLPPYQVTTLITIGVCFLYWFKMFYLFPKLGGYKLKAKFIVLNDGLIMTKWVKRYV
ncbi:similar to Saccharomyces cerevisiae YHL036W MUP3 Low affinity methionine permease, similar to Mup1p [Maudiozyma saulgeensis]|uniref:Similar to Saccharomyces cerevisiae YHL036W MUP3 Low affinity methionine permease, similar to Mup1p n=1 Tax=Maudiozyma saulgeensis TaxID=1789683 RepID=A0A1X7R447_9SACH|nr:similar to Saccharomyces cerevisiae YHL036W MUP3 Low affinity methionine permease, similar to Mup1p [Kazachstania saulgeensis]